MFYLILSLIVLAAISAILGWLHNRHKSATSADEDTDQSGTTPRTVDAECCGQHEVCERDSLLTAVSKEIEYFDDEELDRFSGINSADYADEQVEEFRNILYSMREDEVAAWVRSLGLRAVELPDALKPEVLLIISERRERG